MKKGKPICGSEIEMDLLATHTFGHKLSDTAVCIVIFTEYDLLEQQFTALGKQTTKDFDVLIVAGYKSDDGTLSRMAKQSGLNCVIFKRKFNDGPAGGFYLAKRLAEEKGYLKMFMVESDCLPVSPFLIEKASKLLDEYDVVNTISKSYDAKKYGKYNGITGGWRYTGLRSGIDVYPCPTFVFFAEDRYFSFQLASRKDLRVFIAQPGSGMEWSHPDFKKVEYFEQYIMPTPRQFIKNRIMCNNALFSQRASGFRAYLLECAGIYLLAHIWGFHFIINGRLDGLKLFAQGFLDGITYNGGFCPEKVLTRKMEEVKESEIAKLHLEKPAYSNNAESYLKDFLESIKYLNKDVLMVPPLQGIAKALLMSRSFYITVENQTFLAKQESRAQTLLKILILPFYYLLLPVGFAFSFLVMFLSTFIFRLDCMSVYRKMMANAAMEEKRK